MVNSIIVATGSYIPDTIIPNSHFLDNEFYGDDGQKLERSNAEIVKKLQEITEIRERRYVTDDLNTSDIASMAAKEGMFRFRIVNIRRPSTIARSAMAFIRKSLEL